jgi:hypothetical protein
MEAAAQAQTTLTATEPVQRGLAPRSAGAPPSKKLSPPTPSLRATYSDARRAAINRANSAHSTGARTETGKQRSSSTPSAMASPPAPPSCPPRTPTATSATSSNFSMNISPPPPQKLAIIPSGQGSATMKWRDRLSFTKGGLLGGALCAVLMVSGASRLSAHYSSGSASTFITIVSGSWPSEPSGSSLDPIPLPGGSNSASCITEIKALAAARVLSLAEESVKTKMLMDLNRAWPRSSGHFLSTILVRHLAKLSSMPSAVTVLTISSSRVTVSSGPSQSKMYIRWPSNGCNLASVLTCAASSSTGLGWRCLTSVFTWSNSFWSACCARAAWVWNCAVVSCSRLSNSDNCSARLLISPASFMAVSAMPCAAVDARCASRAESYACRAEVSAWATSWSDMFWSCDPNRNTPPSAISSPAMPISTIHSNLLTHTLHHGTFSSPTTPRTKITPKTSSPHSEVLSPVVVAGFESDKKYPIPIGTWAGALGFVIQGLGLVYILFRRIGKRKQ